jgi:hypothetical protein
MGNDGKLLRRLVDTADASDNLKKVAVDLPSAAIQSGVKHVAVFAHGGLNSEEVALGRAMRMGPWFIANGIYPIFVVWRTSLAESLGQIGQDMIEPLMRERSQLRSKGLGDVFDNAMSKLQDKFDRAFEAAAEKVVGKAVWTQMKQNASAAALKGGGTRQLVDKLRELIAGNGGTSLHLIGHSAGSILLGHMLDAMSGLVPKSVNLYAPACTMSFANRYFGKAIASGAVPAKSFFVHNLSEENEQGDTVALYGKSLLYLVSRAFEDPRSMPLLGLDKCWSPEKTLDKIKEALAANFAESALTDVRDWMNVVRKFAIAPELVATRQIVTQRQNAQQEVKIDAVHGSFDNNIDVLNTTFSRILGTAKPLVPIRDLTNF